MRRYFAFDLLQCLETRESYSDLVETIVGRVIPAALEAWMSFHGWELQGPTFKRKMAETDASRLRKDIRTVLEARSPTLSPEGAARLEACTDVERLERWHRAAVTVAVERELWDVS